MSGVEWIRGVPWAPKALDSARRDGSLEAITEVARGWIEEIKHDPSRAELGEYHTVVRGRWIAVVSPELVVVGHGRAEEGLSAASDVLAGGEVAGKGGRGPKTYAELVEWLADEGYEVRDASGRTNGHRAVFDKDGRRRLPLASTPSDVRSIRNDVAQCRRVLGVALRRQG